MSTELYLAYLRVTTKSDVKQPTHKLGRKEEPEAHEDVSEVCDRIASRNPITVTKLPHRLQWRISRRRFHKDVAETCALVAAREPIAVTELPSHLKIRVQQRRIHGRVVELCAQIAARKPITITKLPCRIQQRVEHRRFLNKIKEVEANRKPLLTSIRPPRLQKLGVTMRRYVTFVLRVTRQAQVNY